MRRNFTKWWSSVRVDRRYTPALDGRCATGPLEPRSLAAPFSPLAQALNGLQAQSALGGLASQQGTLIGLAVQSIAPSGGVAASPQGVISPSVQPASPPPPALASSW